MYFSLINLNSIIFFNIEYNINYVVRNLFYYLSLKIELLNYLTSKQYVYKMITNNCDNKK